MTTEKILRRIDIIRMSNKNNGKIKELITTVENAIKAKPDFDLRDSLEEKLTLAVCH